MVNYQYLVRDFTDTLDKLQRVTTNDCYCWLMDRGYRRLPSRKRIQLLFIENGLKKVGYTKRGEIIFEVIQ